MEYGTKGNNGKERSERGPERGGTSPLLLQTACAEFVSVLRLVLALARRRGPKRGHNSSTATSLKRSIPCPDPSHCVLPRQMFQSSRVTELAKAGVHGLFALEILYLLAASSYPVRSPDTAVKLKPDMEVGFLKTSRS